MLRTRVPLAIATLGFVMFSAALGYIHFPPMTLPKMCKMSHHIQVLKVDKFEKERGVILYETVETLKGANSRIANGKHVFQIEADGAKRILDWAAAGKPAVIFWIEGGNKGVGYVFVDEYCYTVDYNSRKYWFFLRAEPEMSACYFGPADKLRDYVKDVLAGKEVNVPTKDPEMKIDVPGRAKEINQRFEKNK